MLKVPEALAGQFEILPQRPGTGEKLPARHGPRPGAFFMRPIHHEYDPPVANQPKKHQRPVKLCTAALLVLGIAIQLTGGPWGAVVICAVGVVLGGLYLILGRRFSGPFEALSNTILEFQGLYALGLILTAAVAGVIWLISVLF